MHSLPDSSIPVVLSQMDMRDVCRCACLFKNWLSKCYMHPTDVRQWQKGLGDGRLEAFKYAKR